MKVSLRWLKELVPGSERVAALDGAEAAQALTAVGLEVESVEGKGRALAGVVVAEVLAVRPHPAADKLRLVQVRAGSRQEEVVCGAPNVPPPGGRVVWAPPGAHLPKDRVMEARAVRGVMSPGMLCSEVELGLSEQGDGILILSPSDPSGAGFAEHFGVADDVLEVNVTPNRSDALSHLGIARELAAFFGVRARPLPPPATEEVEASAGSTRDVRIADEDACARYQARFIGGLTLAPSPLSVRLRLAHCGVRPISNLVDVTNYVLLELGQPLHAFDLDKLTGGITVRRARPGEVTTTLDGASRALEPEDIVIADERGAVALGGVMGGAGSEVSATTRRVLLEAASFDPRSVRRTSKRLGLISEASYRFERGVDPEGIPRAAERAARLLAQLGGGAVVRQTVDRYPRPPARRKAEVTVGQLRRLSGLPLDAAAATRELEKVADDPSAAGPAVTVVGAGDAAKVVVAVPSFRPDLVLPEDLVEEVLRLGRHYESEARIERVLANARPAPNPEDPAHRARDVLAGAGLSEIVSWGFVARARLAAIAGDLTELADGVAVKNPISADYEIMRTSLLPGLADALGRNVARGIEDVRLFEVGPVIRKRPGEPLQLEQLGLLMTGRVGGWLKPGEPLDFFDLKRVVIAVCSSFGLEPAFSPDRAIPYLHPGVAAALELGGKRLGCAGELHPLCARRLGIERRVFYAELDLDTLASAASAVRSVAPPRFPAVTRDLSFWIDVAISAAEQRAAFTAASEALLADLQVREDFRDPKYAPPGKKGMLWSMTYRAEDRTLTDADADAAHARVVAALSERLSIKIR